MAMRQVRPTLKAFNQLPKDSFKGNDPWKTIKRNKDNGQENLFYKIDLSELSQNLLDNSRKVMNGGYSTNLHQAASTAAGCKVFEIRDTSSGWRGAVVLDTQGDPWLVYADRHDRFHAHVTTILAKTNKHNWLPRSLDYKIRDKEEALKAFQKTALHVLIDLITGIRAAVVNDEASEFDITFGDLGSSGHVDVEVMTDQTPLSVDMKCVSEGLVSVNVRLSDPQDRRARDCLANVVSCIQPNQDYVYMCYLCNRDYKIELCLSKARIVQLTSLLIDDEGYDLRTRAMLSKSPDPQTLLHYTDKHYIVQGMLDGQAVLSLCGTWFVPTQDEYTDECKGICPVCESIKPLANELFGGGDEM